MIWVLIFVLYAVFIPMATTIIRAKDFDPGKH
jgi:hypothetical protein